MYSKGMGVEQDLDQSIRWMEKAAENGHPQAAPALMKLKGIRSG